MSTVSWYEIFANDGHETPSVLLVRPAKSGFEVLDPSQRGARVFESAEYREVRDWLNDDEFEFVARREFSLT